MAVEINTPGLTVRPLVNMGDGHVFNQLFFDDVRAPRDNVIGEVKPRLVRHGHHAGC